MIPAAPGLSGLLSLAAMPTFAVMALLSSVSAGSMDHPCPVAPLGGMTFMYAIMSVFHAPPWLQLIVRRNGFQRLRL